MMDKRLKPCPFCGSDKENVMHMVMMRMAAYGMGKAE